MNSKRVKITMKQKMKVPWTAAPVPICERRPSEERVSQNRRGDHARASERDPLTIAIASCVTTPE